MIASVSQFTSQFLSNADGLNVHICIGYVYLTAKKPSIQLIFLAQVYVAGFVLFFIFSAVRIRNFKKKNYVLSISLTTSNQEARFHQKLKNVFNLSFSNMMTVGYTFIMLLPSFIIPFYFNKKEPEQLNHWPYYQLYQFSYHGLVLLTFFSITLRFYLTNRDMRTALSREICDRLCK
jgi:hypothetical protein